MTAHDPKLVEAVAIVFWDDARTEWHPAIDEKLREEYRQVARAALDTINLDERIRAAVLTSGCLAGS